MQTLNKGDLRIRKTHTALKKAMFESLSRRSFNEITVNDLCTEALISRATFYSHFNDKYDLLKYILDIVRKEIIRDVYRYEDLERDINKFVSENKKLITNILKDANSETLTLVRGFMLSAIEPAKKRQKEDFSSPQHIMLFNFIAGGLFSLLMYIAENDFPKEISMMNSYIYKMLEVITVWDAEQEN